MQSLRILQLQQLVTSELLPEQSLLDKALEEIVEETDKAEQTCEKLMIPRPVLDLCWVQLSHLI